jgi:hypothetical protein
MPDQHYLARGQSWKQLGDPGAVLVESLALWALRRAEPRLAGEVHHHGPLLSRQEPGQLCGRGRVEIGAGENHHRRLALAGHNDVGRAQRGGENVTRVLNTPAIQPPMAPPGQDLTSWLTSVDIHNPLIRSKVSRRKAGGEPRRSNACSGVRFCGRSPKIAGCTRISSR